ncbi:MAG TPA: iron-containing alcohol dehydrogenase [Spirochaetia bacterium]|nr:iron-containing alcohol dehydrogenase [Spirochaetia bacterium]
MPDILFQIPTRVVFGLDTVNRIGQLAAEFGERVFLVTEAILYEGKVINKVQEVLDKKGMQHIVFDEVVPNATSSTVDDGVTLARGSHADVVIGLGGMRTLSIAKCIAMTATAGNDMDDFLSGVQPQNPPLAFIEVPTTCRDPFIFTEEYLMVDGRDRSGRIGRAQKGITKAVLIDPKLSLTLPAKYTATTIMDTLLGCIEGYLSARANLLSDTYFARAIEMLGVIVKEGIQSVDDIRTRMNASMAGMLMGLGLTTSRQGIGAALSYAINARFMAPKSWVSTILLPAVMEFAVNVRGDRIAHIAKLLGEDVSDATSVEAPMRAIDALRRVISSLALPTRLREFDLSLDEMIEVAGAARSFDMMNYLPRVVSTEDIYELIKSAF